MAAVTFQSVSKTFATPHGPFQALSGVSFEIAEGEFFGLLGPNGAGKTTLISILAGLSRASGGRVSVMGHDVQNDFAAAGRMLGVVPQELVYDPFFSVRETLRLQSGYFGVKNNDRWIDELLAHLGLTDKADANMRQLSGGMKRRVLVAQALVHKPPVIVLDEPTAGVDVELRQTLWQFVSQLNRQGHAVLLTTHYLKRPRPCARDWRCSSTGMWWHWPIRPNCWRRRPRTCCASRPTMRCPRTWRAWPASPAAWRRCPRATPRRSSSAWRPCAPPACAWRMSKSARPISRTCSST